MRKLVSKLEHKKDKLPKNSRKIPCIDYALFLVSLRAQSVAQLTEKLQRKNYDQKEIDTVISRLSELKYLDDQQFAQIYFENLKKYKSFGYFGIKKKLIEKKLPVKQIDKLLKSFSEKEEKELAVRVLEKIKGKTEQQKMRALQSRGFRIDTILKAMKKG